MHKNADDYRLVQYKVKGTQTWDFYIYRVWTVELISGMRYILHGGPVLEHEYQSEK
jgi:hypothetical protein